MAKTAWSKTGALMVRAGPGRALFDHVVLAIQKQIFPSLFDHAILAIQKPIFWSLFDHAILAIQNQFF